MLNNIKVRLLPPLDPMDAQLIKDFKKFADNIQQQYGPSFEHAIKEQQKLTQLAKAYENLGLPIKRLQEAMKPAIENAQKVQDKLTTYIEESRNHNVQFLKNIEKNKELFNYTPPTRHPSAEEIADAVLQKMAVHQSTVVKGKKIKKSLPVVKLPLEARWEDVELRFKDGHTIDLFYKHEFKGGYYHADLDFAMGNTKDGRPDKQWQLLSLLSIATQFNKDFVATAESLAVPLKTTPGLCEKMKSKLDKKLRTAFGIKQSPFYPYNKEVGYRTKFTLVPEPAIRRNGDLHGSAGHLFEDVEDGNSY